MFPILVFLCVSAVEFSTRIAEHGAMTLEGAERHYRGQAGQQYQQGKRAVPERAIPWVARARAQKLLPFARAEDVLLEYGAGLGWNLGQLPCRRKLAFDLEDHIEPAIRQAGVEFVIDTKSLAGGTMDVVLCHHALEHVMHPPTVLEEIRRLLRPVDTLREQHLVFLCV